MMLHSFRAQLSPQSQQNEQQITYTFEPSYAKQTQMYGSPVLNQQLLSDTKCNSINSNKSKGLSLSLKKLSQFRKTSIETNSATNPQCLENSSFLRSKKSSTMIRTQHSIRNLGGSISKIRNRKNMTPQKHSFREFVNEQTDSKTKSQRFLNRNILLTASRQIKNEQLENSSYQIKIVQPYSNQQKLINCNNKITQNKQGKASQLKSKHFLRSKNDQNLSSLISGNLFNQSKTLKVFQMQRQPTKKENRKLFIQNYIQKPLINSIIMTSNNMFDEETQSPVKRLKNRLQLNSINNIYERQTMISHDVKSSNKSSIKVQESIIVHRNISGNFIPVTHKVNIFQDHQEMPYKLYLGQQIDSQLLLTIKQLPPCQFSNFASELLVYQQVESCKILSNSILNLIKFSTDSDKHMLIKQPFTEVLTDFLDNLVGKRITQQQFESQTKQIIFQIKLIIESLAIKGMYLKKKVNIQDFVYCFSILKIENMSCWHIGTSHMVSVQDTLNLMKGQIQAYFNKVSGNFQF